MPSGTLEYVDVHKAFDAPVLAGVSLRVARGESLAIVGPSGAGKSVLLKLTNGLVPLDRGDILIDGESVASRARGTLAAIRRKIGYVFQSAALFDSLTVGDNVAMGIPEDVARGLGAAEVRARTARALGQVNLDPGLLLQKRPAELSGGMRKRVGIARAVVGEPEFILYDEPVTGLDPVNSAVVERLIREIGDRAGVTSVCVTHDVAGALRICDRVALLCAGRVRFEGTPTEFRESDDPLVRAFTDFKAAAALDPDLLEAR